LHLTPTRPDNGDMQTSKTFPALNIPPAKRSPTMGKSGKGGKKGGGGKKGC
jgi:hypothetical protein